MAKERIPRSISDEFCQKIQPQAKSIYLRDSKVKGLVLRVTPTGSKSWIFCYIAPCPKRKWRKRKKGLGPFRDGRNDVAGLTVAAARREAERLKNEVRHKGADPIDDRRRQVAERAKEQAGRVLVKELFERWASTDLIKRIEELEKICKPDKKRPSYALVIYDGDIRDQIEALEVDADFVVCLPDNGRGDLSEEIPKGGYKIFLD